MERDSSKTIKQIISSITIWCMVLLQPLPQNAWAQTASGEAGNANNANYGRSFGEEYNVQGNYNQKLQQILDIILPQPTGNYDQVRFNRQRNKATTKLRGEANEELVISLMALNSTFTPPTNDISVFSSLSNTFLTTENGAAQALQLLTNSLNTLSVDLDNLTENGQPTNLQEQLQANPEDTPQITALRKHMDSFELLRQALTDKLNRYNGYTLTPQSQPYIDDEGVNFNACQNGNPPGVQGISTISNFLTGVENTNIGTINNLNTSIASIISQHTGLSSGATVQDIDNYINNTPTLTPQEIQDLQQTQTNITDRDQLILDNTQIVQCRNDFAPRLNEPTSIKTEEDDYMFGPNGVLNGIVNSGAFNAPPFPPPNSVYNSFSLANVCLTIPPSVQTEVDQVKSNCNTWITHYRSPYVVNNAAVNRAAAVADTRYMAISNCGRPGASCDLGPTGPMQRISDELAALAKFPFGRLVIAEMLLQSLDTARQFYSEILYDPQLYNCENINHPNQQTQEDLRFNCYNQQRNGNSCIVSGVDPNRAPLGMDCDRAEVGYTIYKFIIDSRPADTKQEITTNLAENNGSNTPPAQQVTIASSQTFSGEINDGGVGGEKGPGGNPANPISFKSTSSGDTSSLGQNGALKDGKNNDGNSDVPTDFSNNLASSRLKLSKFGAKLLGRDSFKVINKTLKKKFRLKKGSKTAKFGTANTDKIANAISQNFGRFSIQKFSSSYGAADNLFASANPKAPGTGLDLSGKQTIKKDVDQDRKSGKIANLYEPGSINISSTSGSKRKKYGKDGYNKDTSGLDEDDPSALGIDDPYASTDAYRRRQKYYAKIHSKKIGLFDIISRRFRRTDIYFDNAY